MIKPFHCLPPKIYQPLYSYLYIYISKETNLLIFIIVIFYIKINSFDRKFDKKYYYLSKEE